MFMQPGVNVPQIRQAAEGIKYGTVMDPFKNIDPKEQGRVKNRILELHGPGSAGFIPDKDLPWSQNERENSFGGQKEMSTFGLPQKDSMIKARHHGDSKYSPLYSGAVYAALSKISQWSSKGMGQKAATYDSNTGSSTSGFNQKDHYGHKDPLGNIFHVDMKTKTLTCDFSKLSECNFTFPKTTFNHKNTKWNRNKGTFEGGSPSQIQGMASGGGSSAASADSSGGDGDSQEGGDQVDGDIIWNVDGQHQSTIQKKVTHTWNDEHQQTIAKAVNLDHKDDHGHKVGKTYSRSAGQDTTVSGGQSRSDTYGKTWSSSARNTAWSWLTSRNILGG